MIKKPSKTSLRNKADSLCRNIAYQIGKCEASGEGGECKGRFEWAHIRTREIMGLRYDRRNWLLLCSSHHWYFGKNPLAFAEFVKRNKGKQVHDFLQSYKVIPSSITVEWYQEQIEMLTTVGGNC